MDVAWIVGAIFSILGLVILAMFYTYLKKLEKAGCPCARSKYEPFVKAYTVLAIAISVLLLVFPPQAAAKLGGPGFGAAYLFLLGLYLIGLFVYFIMAFKYIQYLRSAKCACSADIRREVMYVYSILEVLLLGLVVILPLVLLIVNGAVMLALTATKGMMKNEAAGMDVVINPIKAVKKLPGTIKQAMGRGRRQ